MILLRPGQTYKTENDRDALKIAKGDPDVFVVPHDKGIAGRPKFLIHAEEGMTIPAICYTDSDYVTWTLMFEAKGNCEIMVAEGGSTRPLKKKFGRLIGIDDGGGDGVLEKTLRERYVAGLVKDDVLITRGEQQREKEKAETEAILQDVAGRREQGAADERDPARAPVEKSERRHGRTSKHVKETLPVITAFAAGSLAIAVIVMVLLARDISVAGAMAGAAVYIALRQLVKWKLDHMADAAAEADQEVLIQDLYDQVPDGNRQDDAQIRALGVLTNYDKTRRMLQDGSEGIMALMIAAGALIATAVLSPVPAGIAFATTFIAGYVLSETGRKSSHRQTGVARLRDKGNAGLFEALYRIEKIRLSGAVEHVLRVYYTRKRDEKERDRIRTGRLRAGETLAALIIAAGAAGIIAFVVLRGGYDPGDGLAAMVGCGVAMYEGVCGFKSIAESKAIGRSIHTVGDTTEETPGTAEKTPKMAEKTPEMAEETPDSAAMVVDTFDKMSNGEPVLELDHISFAYDGRVVCRDLSFGIGKGEHIGIVGPSGCGKSTLMEIISGRRSPDAGEVRFLGRNLKDPVIDELRSISSTVMQNDQLLTASIGENLTMGASEADSGAVVKALRDAGIEDEIAAMPMGFDTLIREDGENISAGQKQKLLIARALVKNPRILFFDEAESELSREDQDRIWEAIRARKITQVTISHRYQTICKCDRILVLDDGEIVEHGSTEELVLAKGRFYELMRRQL